MYGTIARLHLKEGTEVDLERLNDEFRTLNVPGSIGEYVYRMDADPRECYMAVLFTDKESYWKNAESPEQAERYQAFRALLDADPEWHDGEVIAVMTPAASPA
jgi:hypothetical protein